MKIVIGRDVLLPLMRRATAAASTRSTIPILSNVLLTADDGQLSALTTDTDMWAAGAVPCEVEEPGSVAVDVALLLAVLRSAPAGSDVALSWQDGDSAKLVAGRSRASLPTLPADTFPPLPGATLPFSAKIAPAELRRLIQMTRYAASTDRARYYLCGVHFHSLKDGDRALLRAVGCDGNQLALAETDAPAFDGIPAVSVPGPALDAIVQMLDGAADPVCISASEHLFRVDVGGASLITKVIDGSFPDYMRVIPRDNQRRLTVTAAVMDRAVRSALVLAKDGSRSIRLALSKGQICVSARDINGALISEEIEADYDGDDFDVGVNGRHWSEALSRLNGGDAEVRFGDRATPIAIGPVGDTSSMTVQMPLRC